VRLRLGRRTKGAVTLLLLGGCARPGTAPGTKEGPLAIALYAAPLTADPHLESEFLTSGVLANTFEGLTRLDRMMRVEPALASSWDTPTPTTWRFRLRRGVRFHDGRPLGARDVVWSLERARHHPRTGVSSYLADVAEVRSPSADVVEIRTQASSSLILNRLAFVGIVPAGSPEEIREPIGTGPYRLEIAAAGGDIVLRRFDGYWGGRPEEPEVRLRVLRDPEQAVAALVSGRIDVALALSPAAARRLGRERCCRVVAQPGVVVEDVRFRIDRAPFSDARVRRAVHLALDREALAQRTYLGWAEPASQHASPGTLGFDPVISVPSRDLAEARRLLAVAGHGSGLSVILEFREGRDAREIVRQLAEAGIHVTPRARPWAEMLARLRAGEVSFYYGALVADTGDAGDILDSVVHSRQARSGLGLENTMGYSSPEVDRLLQEARTAPTLLDRRTGLQGAMRRVVEDLPIVPLVVPYDLYGIRSGISWAARLDGRVLAADLHRTR
jgi:peptide/nickel transport system substrate-binding protein